MTGQMNIITPYLFFNGRCREAMQFYAKVFGGDLTAMTYKEAQGQGGCPEGAEDKIIHARLVSPELQLLASDTPYKDPVALGENIHLSVSVDRLDRLEKLFAALSEKGEVKLALHDAFWGAKFGMLTDRFGFHWMLSCPKK